MVFLIQVRYFDWWTFWNIQVFNGFKGRISMKYQIMIGLPWQAANLSFVVSFTFDGSLNVSFKS